MVRNAVKRLERLSYKVTVDAAKSLDRFNTVFGGVSGTVGVQSSNWTPDKLTEHWASLHADPPGGGAKGPGQLTPRSRT